MIVKLESLLSFPVNAILVLAVLSTSQCQDINVVEYQGHGDGVRLEPSKDVNGGSTLRAIHQHIIDLQRLVGTQNKQIARILSGQRRLLKARSLNVKLHKQTHRYLKRMSVACSCVRASISSCKTEEHLLARGKGRSRRITPIIFIPRVPNEEQASKIQDGFDELFNEIRSNKGHTSNKDNDNALADEKVLTVKRSRLFSDSGNKSDDHVIGHTIGTITSTPSLISTTSISPIAFSTTSFPTVTVSDNGANSDTITTTVMPILKLRELITDTDFFNEDNYDVQCDLMTGVVTGTHSDVTWLMTPSQSSRYPCGRQGLVRLAFHHLSSNERHDALKIDMWFKTPRGWVFDLGDSQSNDGWSGDGSTQEHDCEAQGYGSAFSVHGSDRSPNPFNKMLYQDNRFIQSRVTLIIRNEAIMWNNHAGNVDFLDSPALFALNNQSDGQGPINNDVYLSFNRVIAGTYRRGRGLCKVALKWI